jgi:hypothetical protein
MSFFLEVFLLAVQSYIGPGHYFWFPNQFFHVQYGSLDERSARRKFSL